MLYGQNRFGLYIKQNFFSVTGGNIRKKSIKVYGRQIQIELMQVFKTILILNTSIPENIIQLLLFFVLFYFLHCVLFIKTETRVDKNIKRNSFQDFSQKRKCMYVIIDQKTLIVNLAIYSLPLSLIANKFTDVYSSVTPSNIYYSTLSICKQFNLEQFSCSLYMYLISLPVFKGYASHYGRISSYQHHKYFMITIEMYLNNYVIYLFFLSTCMIIFHNIVS